MPSNQLQTQDMLGSPGRELEKAAVIPFPRPITIDRDIIERAAQALFEFVFSSCEGREWSNCDEKTKEGFRGEAKAVIVAAWSLLLR